jgi:hypothetical protein
MGGDDDTEDPGRPEQAMFDDAPVFRERPGGPGRLGQLRQTIPQPLQVPPGVVGQRHNGSNRFCDINRFGWPGGPDRDVP